MKKLATLIAVIGLTGVFVSASYAQAAGPKGGPPTSGTTQGSKEQKPGDAAKKGPLAGVREEMSKLNLTPDQKKKIQTLQADMQKKQKAMRDDVKAGKLDRKDVRTKTAELLKTYMEGVKGVLTTEQWKKIEAAMPKAGKGKKKG